MLGLEFFGVFAKLFKNFGGKQLNALINLIAPFLEGTPFSYGVRPKVWTCSEGQKSRNNVFFFVF